MKTLKRKILSLFLALSLALSLSAPALAATPEEAQDDVELLYNLGLFLGSGTNADGTPNFALDRAPTRAEAVTILVRLLGGEDAALAGSWTTPFTDVPAWAQPYVGYAYTKGYTNGVGTTIFGASSDVTTAQFLTFLLRALGYRDGVDFSWTDPWALTDQLKVTHGEYNADTETFLRADAVIVSASALYAPVKSSDTTLLQTLLDSGAITGNTVVIWDYTQVLFDENFASFLFYPVESSPANFTSFHFDRVTVNGLSCDTLQVNTPDEVNAYMASLGYDQGGFGYIEITFDQAAALEAATEYYTDEAGNTYPLLAFSFTCTGITPDGSKVTENFTDYYYLDE